MAVSEHGFVKRTGQLQHGDIIKLMTFFTGKTRPVQGELQTGLASSVVGLVPFHWVPFGVL